jgi:(1->4)-alpha-D-glucan 1-alpha-D-glucosylmutase
MNQIVTDPTTIVPTRRIPRATYRLQLNPNFTFADARALLDYLDELGISDCYASPIFQACAGSTHGYDICDHSQISQALGGEAAFESFAADLRARHMGLILDVVPNHMGISDSCNTWWMDVLENGPGSLYAASFDIDWHPVRPELENKVLLPILEDQYGDVLEAGKLRLAYADGAFDVYYYATRLPVAPRTYRHILRHLLPMLVDMLGEDHAYVQELQSILTAIHYLPPRTALPAEKLAERNREKEIIKRRLAALEQASPEVRGSIDATVRVFNGDIGNPNSFDLLDKLIDEQAYRPAFWRVAAEEIHYRRFFDINELAAIRVELPEVFQATHALTQRLLAEGKATGLRIDHPDGLWDPPHYFRQLQQSFADLIDHAPATWNTAIRQEHVPHSSAVALEPSADRRLYVVAEKILSDGEALPRDWDVDGTTGYDFLNTVNGLFVQSDNAAVFQTLYSHFIGGEANYRHMANATKKMIMLVSLASEISELSQQLERIAQRNRRYRDFTLGSLTFTIREVLACLPIYRTYMTGPATVTERDQVAIEAAVAEAKKQNPRTAAAIFDFIRDTLLFRNVQRFTSEDTERLADFVMKFQQLSGPVMAKGVEDTAFYRYNRLISLNEVGGHPELFGSSVADFHLQNVERRRHWPYTMLATSTHDTKRSEDVRARINVLSEIPDTWLASLAHWSEHNTDKKTLVDGELAPDRNDEYLLYQTLLGVWPFDPTDDQRPKTTDQRNEQNPLSSLVVRPSSEFIERIAAYMLKATKEAKVHTSWVNPNTAYDEALRGFIFGMLGETGALSFLENLLPLARRVAWYGQFNSLAQVLLKLTSPGVPDIYQGSELWDFSLVDPDNRRPVDFEQRRALLTDLKQQIEQAGDDLMPLAQRLLNTSQDGRIKLYLIERVLSFRRRYPDLFANGSYVPLEAHGTKREHVCAFTRVLNRDAFIVVTPRLVVGLTNGTEQPPIGAAVWRDTWLALPQEQACWRYRNLLTGEVLSIGWRDGTPGLPLAALCGQFPVGLFVRIVVDSHRVLVP